jgi:hypothetical protein
VKKLGDEVKMNCVDLFSWVVDVCPSFAAQVEQHYADNGELLCHILIADLGRLVAGYFTGKTNIVVGPPTEAGLRAILAVLDAGLIDADDDVQNAIAVSFVEHIWIQPYFAELEPMLGPNLSAEVVTGRGTGNPSSLRQKILQPDALPTHWL